MSENLTTNLEEGKDIIKKADELICKLGIRKNAVTIVLEWELFKESERGLIRNTNLQLDTNGQLSSNYVPSDLYSSAEILLQQFSEDLVAIRTKVILILSNISNNEEEEDSTVGSLCS